MPCQEGVGTRIRDILEVSDALGRRLEKPSSCDLYRLSHGRDNWTAEGLYRRLGNDRVELPLSGIKVRWADSG